MSSNQQCVVNFLTAGAEWVEDRQLDLSHLPFSVVSILPPWLISNYLFAHGVGGDANSFQELEAVQGTTTSG